MKLITINIYTSDEAERLSADELIIAFGAHSALARAIAEDGYEIPKALASSMKSVKRELDHKLEADLERELENIENRIAATSTVQERRAAMGTRREEILEKLGRKAKAAGSTTE